MNISKENIEEWCFRYLEKDLNEKECAFFEKELQTNAALQKEYTLWEKTKLTDTSIGVKPNFNKNIYQFNNQFSWLLVELTSVVTLCVLSMYFISPSKPPASVIQSDQKIEVAKENKSTPEQELIQEKKIYTLRNLELNLNESIHIDSDKLIIDSIQSRNSFPEKQDSITPSAKKIVLDSIQSPKDTIERKEKPKAKSQKRKTYNGSRLIPINNDL